VKSASDNRQNVKSKLGVRDARILIVDDDVGTLCLCVNILNRLGYRNIITLSDPQEAFGGAEKFRPDLLLLDLFMPRLDGFDILARFRQGSLPYTDFPIIVFSGESTLENKRRSLTAGAADFLSKPFDSAELNVRITNVLQARLLRRQIEAQNEVLEKRVAERTRELESALDELKATQRQIVQQERLRAFSEMASGIAHDFNNALMCIIGYSEILTEDPTQLADAATVFEYLKFINTAGRDASEVVGRLRDFYRPREEGDVFVTLDLNKVVEEVVPLTQPKWRDQALATGRIIEIQLDLAKIPPIAGNAGELREVATNLIFNAVDAIAESGTVTLRTMDGGDHILLEVRDTGSGMSEETRTRCLEPFFSTKGEKGTGLGLSMVFGIIKRHEGAIEIESQPGSGTAIFIRIPTTKRRICDEGAKVGKPNRFLHVLVVDDDPHSRHVLEKYFTADGHNVDSAADAAGALALFEGTRFDLVATDYAMPGLNGLQLTEHFRKSRPDLPVILVTGFTDSGLSESTQFDQINISLRKPVSVDNLRAAVMNVLNSTPPSIAPNESDPAGGASDT
jgi:signal transduction histidine kinase